MPLLRRHLDLLLAAVLTLVLTIEVLLAEPHDQARAVPSAVLAGLALALRRRMALVMFLLSWAGLGGVIAFAGDVSDESLSFVVIFLVAHYSLGRWSTGKEAWAGVLALLGSMIAFAVGDARANDQSWTDIQAASIVFVLAFVGGPWAAGLAIRLRREREDQLDAQNRQLHDEQDERARRAVAEERSRIARELHDVVSHAISVTVLQARGARRTLDTDPAAARTALDAIELTNTAALGDMRRLLAVLRDTEPDGRPDEAHAPLPSLRHLDALVEHVRASGLPVEIEVVGEHVDVPPGVDLSAYRIVQEALTNVLKHAENAPTRVRLEYADDALTVSVHDRGGSSSSAGTSNGSGHGLIGIRERVAVVGGEVEAGPRDGGFEVRARLPYALETA